MKTQQTPIVLAGDGGCDSLVRFGTWAAAVVTQSERRILYGVVHPSTVSRCEIMPVLEGLRHIRGLVGGAASPRVLVVSDSQYVIQALGGMCATKKNRDLWAAVREMAKNMSITAVWRERNSHPIMELCDSVSYALRTMMYRGDEDTIHSRILAVADDSLKNINVKGLP